MHTVTAIPAQTIRNIALVGRVVTYQGEQYKCYSVEGYDYYAFCSALGGITADFAMTPSEWKRQGWVFLLPMGAKIGDGVGIEVPLTSVKTGLTLTKRTV